MKSRRGSLLHRMQVGVMKVSWVGQTFSLNTRCSDAPVKKTRNRCSREDRKTMVQSFINKYQISNDGSFPSLNLTHREVGGSFYTVREIVREIIQENKVLAPGNPNSQVLRLKDYVESDLVPHSSLHLPLPVLGTYLSEATVNKANDASVKDRQIGMVDLEDDITTTHPSHKSICSEAHNNLEASQTSFEVTSDSLSQVYKCVFENVGSTGGVVTYSTGLFMPLEEVDHKVSDNMEGFSYSSRQSDDLRNSSEASMIIEGYSEEKTVDSVVLELDSFTNEAYSEKNVDLNNISDLHQLSVTSHGDISENSEVSSGDMSSVIHETGPGGIIPESKYEAQPNHLINSSDTENLSSDGLHSSESSNDVAKKRKEESKANPIVDAIKGFFAGLVKLFTQ